jgi:hypothetical protein
MRRAELAHARLVGTAAPWGRRARPARCGGAIPAFPGRTLPPPETRDGLAVPGSRAPRRRRPRHRAGRAALPGGRLGRCIRSPVAAPTLEDFRPTCPNASAFDRAAHLDHRSSPPGRSLYIAGRRAARTRHARSGAASAGRVRRAARRLASLAAHPSRLARWASGARLRRPAEPAPPLRELVFGSAALGTAAHRSLRGWRGGAATMRTVEVGLPEARGCARGVETEPRGPAAVRARSGRRGEPREVRAANRTPPAGQPLRLGPADPTVRCARAPSC